MATQAQDFERIRLRRKDFRSPERIRHHYEVETALARRLRHAPKQRRQRLYTAVYDELLAKVQDHPLLLYKKSQNFQARTHTSQMRFLSRWLKPESTFLELGPGDCSLSFAVANLVKKVYAVDVSKEITRFESAPKNFELSISNGCSVDVPKGTIDIAFSDQLMEHLHPEDAKEQLTNIFRALAQGGRYVCITPNRLYGPRDISEYFDTVATGLHLKEYSCTELAKLFRSVGFSKISIYAGARSLFVRVPVFFVYAVERMLDVMPDHLRKFIADRPPMRALLGIRVVAIK